MKKKDIIVTVDGKISNYLKKLVNRETVLVDRYDADYIDDFKQILRESHNITSIKHPKIKEITTALKLSQEVISAMTLDDVASILDSFISKDDFLPFATTETAKQKHRYHLTKNWDKNKGVKYNGKGETLEKIIDVQVEYSHNQGASDAAWTQRGNIIWDRSVSEPGIPMPHGSFGEIKDKVIKEYIESKTSLKEKTNMLCIGPRWVTEIDFLRERFPIEVSGLDLFSSDQEKIFIGDMHAMPLNDNSYSIVYQKNTYNKSYDIRKALDEAIRILKPGGMIVSDECLDYTIGVNEVARTNIKTNKWYTRHLQKDHNLDRVITDIEYDTNATWINKTGLYAAIIRK